VTFDDVKYQKLKKKVGLPQKKLNSFGLTFIFQIYIGTLLYEIFGATVTFIQKFLLNLLVKMKIVS